MDIVKKESMAMCKAEIADFAESLPLLCARMRACACALACVLPLDAFGRARARARTRCACTALGERACAKCYTSASRGPVPDEHPDEHLFCAQVRCCQQYFRHLQLQVCTCRASARTHTHTHMHARPRRASARVPCAASVRHSRECVLAHACVDRAQNRKMNDCVNQYTTEAHIDAVRFSSVCPCCVRLLVLTCIRAGTDCCGCALTCPWPVCGRVYVCAGNVAWQRRQPQQQRENQRRNEAERKDADGGGRERGRAARDVRRMVFLRLCTAPRVLG